MFYREKKKLIRVIHILANLILSIFQRTLFKKKHLNPLKILVFRTGSIGDSICAMPAMANIRMNFPKSGIHLLSNSGKGVTNLVSIEKLIAPNIFDQIINYENLSRQQLIQTLRVEKYDLIIELPQYDASFLTLLRNMLFFRFLIGIKNGFGWRYARIPLFKKIQEQYGLNENERQRLNKILADNGLKINVSEEFPLHISINDIELVEKLWEKTQFNKDRPTLGIITGAKRPQNRWPIDYFKSVVEHFAIDHNIIFIGGSDDIEKVEKLLTLPNTYSFCGTLTPIQSGLMMRNCKVVLTNDTGPMHLSYAFDTPVLALFSCRDFPGRWYPPENGRHFVLRSSNISCSICLSETCNNNICMKKISPEIVIAQLKNMIGIENQDYSKVIK